MGTYDTIGGTPRHDPVFDYFPPTFKEEVVNILLEFSKALKGTNLNSSNLRELAITAAEKIDCIYTNPNSEMEKYD